MISTGDVGGLLETSEMEWSRQHMDEVKNTQGDALIDFLKDTGLVIVNGRKGKDAISSASRRLHGGN